MTTRAAAAFGMALLLTASVSPAQTARTALVMREKLSHAQKILEALTTSNQALLERESGAMARIAASPRWAELRTPELAGATEAFLKTVADLDADARRRDFDAAAAAYNRMVTTCYQCHRLLKGRRIAR